MLLFIKVLFKTLARTVIKPLTLALLALTELTGLCHCPVPPCSTTCLLSVKGHVHVTRFVDFTFRRRGRKVFHVHVCFSSPEQAVVGSTTAAHIPKGEKEKRQSVSKSKNRHVDTHNISKPIGKTAS